MSFKTAWENGDEAYFSVDIEAAGPIPGEFSMLSIGACLVGSPDCTFYAELRPLNDNYVEAALAVAGLPMAYLWKHGTEPAEAMSEFARWLDSATPPESRPVFVAFNAPFDWMFSHYYFIRFLGRDPFGVSGLDIKAFYMGLVGGDWASTSKRLIDPYFLPDRPHTHHALDDALWQAEVFGKLLAHQRERG
jgi:DNA polymerase III epsilon subunit-like protein